MNWAPTATRVLLWASGADSDTLRKCPSEHKRFVTTGGLVLFTGFMAAVAALFTSHAFWHVPLVLALAFAVAWSIGIMNLDVWLLTSIRRQNTVPLTLLLAAPRLFLAFIVGLVIAQPLLLQAFQSELTRQVREDNQAALSQGERKLQSNGTIDTLRGQQQTLQVETTRLASGKAIESDPYYLAKARQYGKLKSQHAGLTQGNASAREVAVALAGLHDLKRQLTNDAAVARDQEKAQLKTVNTQLQTLQTDQTRGEAKLQADYGANVPIGLADRMEALGALTRRYPSVVDYVKWLFLLLILGVDSLPAVAKTLMSVGRPTLYEQLLDQREEQERAEAERGARIVDEAGAAAEEGRRQMAALKSRHELLAAEDRIKRASAAEAKIGERYVDSQRRVYEMFADKLEDMVSRRAPLWADEWAAKAAREMEAEMDRHLADEGAVE